MDIYFDIFFLSARSILTFDLVKSKFRAGAPRPIATTSRGGSPSGQQGHGVPPALE
jgi:hypothetical protein